jgi:hypothetical protein
MSVCMPVRVSRVRAPATRHSTMRVPAVSACACSASALLAVRQGKYRLIYTEPLDMCAA